MNVMLATTSGANVPNMVWEAVMAIFGFLLGFNVRDSAYRVFEFAVNHAPFGPGPGFSPLIVRVVGFIIGVASGVACLREILA